jgi:SAM-dependent methyltransferase
MSSELTAIMNRNGSDKGNGRHNYTEYYSYLFDARKMEQLKVLEIGIGTINPDMRSNMWGSRPHHTYKGQSNNTSQHGYPPGASLRGWRDYFPNSQIYGCDIDKDSLFNEERIVTFHLDQTDSNSIKSQIVDVDRTYDIIIDDGLHHFPTNWALFHQIHHKLNPGGVYIIEDIIDFDKDLFEDDLQCELVRKGCVCMYLQIPNPHNTTDNNIIVFRKPLS